MHVRRAHCAARRTATIPHMVYEYQRVPWERVSEMAGQGWRLVPIPPVGEIKNVLGQMTMGEPLFAMEREADGRRARAQPVPAGRLLPGGTR